MINAIARMNIAAASDEQLTVLRDWFAKVADHGTERGRNHAAGYLEAIDEEIERRREVAP
jgi:hypothetical protein